MLSIAPCLEGKYLVLNKLLKEKDLMWFDTNSEWSYKQIDKKTTREIKNIGRMFWRLFDREVIIFRRKDKIVFEITPEELKELRYERLTRYKI
jgi:hypothetical protein